MYCITTDFSLKFSNSWRVTQTKKPGDRSIRKYVLIRESCHYFKICKIEKIEILLRRFTKRRGYLVARGITQKTKKGCNLLRKNI